MAIRLKWKNPNSGSSTIRIYRSLTPIDSGTLPAPIVEITDGSTSYLDEFPKYGESFYYMFSVTVNGRTVFSNNRFYTSIIDLGPGPSDLLFGDFKLGYFGKYSMAELGMAPTIYANGLTFNTLYKIVYNGKILFTPGSTISTTVTNLKNSKVLSSGVVPARDPFAGAGGEIRDISGRLFAPRVAKLFDENNLDLDLNNYGFNYYESYTSPTYANTPLGKSELIDILRITRSGAVTVPAPFLLGGTDTTTFSSSGVLGSCDFLNSTVMPGIVNIYNAATSVVNQNFTTNSYFYPVIEYKGTV